MPRGAPIVYKLPKTTLIENPLDPDLDPTNALLPASLNGIVRDGELITRPGMIAFGQALNEQVLGSIQLRDLSDASTIIVGTHRRWWRFSNTTQLYTDISGGVLLTGQLTHPVTFAYWTQGGAAFVLGTNGADPPKEFNLATAAYANISGAPSAARTMATVLNRVVYAYTTESGTVFPTRVRWTSIADRTSNPALAFNDLIDTEDHIIAIRSMGRTQAIVYKENSQWAMVGQPGSDAAAFTFSPLDFQPGPLGPSAVDFGPGGSTHVYLGQDLNLYTFDGVRASILARTQAILAGRFAFISRLVTEVKYFPTKQEIWIAVPLDGDTIPTHLLIYSYIKDGFYLATVPQGLAVSQLGVYFPEFETSIAGMPNTPINLLPDLPINQTGVSARGQFMLAGNAIGTFSLDGSTDNGSPIPNDWQLLLPILPGFEYECDGCEAQFEPGANQTIHVSVLAGPSYDAMTETVIGTINPARGERVATNPNLLNFPVHGRVMAFRFLATTTQQLRLRRLEIWAWTRKLAPAGTP